VRPLFFFGLMEHRKMEISELDDSNLDDAVWFNALTLGERAASLRDAGDAALAAVVDADLAEKRIGRWRSVPPFQNKAHFNRRLAADRIDSEDQLRRLLGEPIERVRGRLIEAPAWLEKIRIAFSHPAPTLLGARRAGPDRLHRLGFLVGIEPLIRLGLERLQSGVDLLHKLHTYVPFDPGAVEQLMLAGLPQQLIKLMARTMVLELNVARMQGILSGNTSEIRYVNFLERLTDPSVMLSILREYPVLARQIVASIDNWVETSLEFLGRLAADWQTICANLNGGADRGKLSLVTVGAGDLHRGGRSVIIATFGDGWKLVYKPHSLAVDVHFRELLVALNRWGDHPHLRAPLVIDRGVYGWTEFVEAQACDTPEQLRRFYERQGGFLALLYFLEATDFHLENLVAAGEHPVLVDLEALFHPRVGLLGSPALSDQLAQEIMARSVLRAGLLPQRIWGGDGKDGIDISGLGGEPGQLSPHLVPVFDGAGTDEMRVVRKQVPLPGSHNRPNIGGKPVNPQGFVDCILGGFTSIYRLMVRRRSELLASDGPIAAFAGDEVRVVLRPTRTYALLLSESCHPDVLRLGFERDRLFDRLWSDIEARPRMAELVPAETADLRRGDVPVFTTRPDSTDIRTSTGDRIRSFFEASSLATVEQRLGEASENDLSRQTWFIRASMASLTVGHDNGVSGSPRTRPAAITTAQSADFIAAARAVGDKLEVLAIEQRDEIAWIGLVLVDGNSWSLLPLSFDLYGGTLGILFFLAYLGSVSGQERYTRLAKRALSSVVNRIDAAAASAGQSPITGNIGAFSGWGGVIYTLAHMGALWGDYELISRAEDMIRATAPLIEKDQSLDVIGGAAGMIGVLCSFFKATGFEPALEIANHCAEHLISKSRRLETGIAWETPVRASRPLTGFSHGAAGIAWALNEIGGLTGEQRLINASLDAIAYERSVFSSEAANWPDFRSDGASAPTGPVYSMTWCHGAPGIALARLMCLQYLDDPAVRADAEVGLETTIRGGFGMNHSLCHGDLGNLEPVLIASQMLHDARWGICASALSSSVLERIRASGWVCGVPQGVETPGLLVGLAGIGYGLLRLADPGGVPSILTLAPPLSADCMRLNPSAGRRDSNAR
jgi:type 2 lantibiotic biosynthesis protein LanM